jgi:hypothetical protein
VNKNLHGGAEQYSTSGRWWTIFHVRKVVDNIPHKKLNNIPQQDDEQYIFVNCCHSNLLSGSTPPPFPLPVKVLYNILYKDSVWWEGVGGVETCWRPSSAGVNTLYLTRFRTCKIARPS